ncbi:MAG: hypothetical protein ACR2K1_14130, partial [Saprospiraceae bacterium]
GKILSGELLRNAAANYRAGEMSYVEMVQFTDKALDIELNHLENMYGLNRTAIELRVIINR